MGLNHNWSVELFPDDIVRTIRSDDYAWTFNWYPLYERAYPIHTLQIETDKVFQSPGYASSEDRIDLNINAGIGSINVREVQSLPSYRR